MSFSIAYRTAYSHVLFNYAFPRRTWLLDSTPHPLCILVALQPSPGFSSPEQRHTQLCPGGLPALAQAAQGHRLQVLPSPLTCHGV